MTTRNRKRIREAVSRESTLKESLTAGLHNLKEVGRVLSAANEEKLRAAQESITAVLAALADDTLATEAKESARKLAEAYSSSASDAGTGAWLIGSLLDLMSEEADEPDELPILQAAFAMLMTWLQIEVAEIGTPEDQEDSAADLAARSSWWGWEAARDRLKAGGVIDIVEVTAPAAPKPIVPLREGQRLVMDAIPLHEAAVREDGSTRIKLIQPGWGSTGYYAPSVLESGAKVFPAGTKMYWDHPTLSEEFERPERSLRDLAGELTTDAVWNPNGVEGAGLYAEAKVYSPFREVLNEIAPSIGVSIVAYGLAENGTAEGKSGQIITQLVAADSVDYVTTPGAGGQVLSLFEAARQRLDIPAPKEASMELEKEPKFIEAVQKATDATQRAARAEEALVLREAKDVVAAKLAESTLPEITRKRLTESLAGNPPAKDGALDKATFETRIAEAIKGEIEYLATLNQTGQIRGMGGSSSTDEDLTPALEAGFQRLGMTESAAKLAAAGRK